MASYGRSGLDLHCHFSNSGHWPTPLEPIPESGLIPYTADCSCMRDIAADKGGHDRMEHILPCTLTVVPVAGSPA